MSATLAARHMVHDYAAWRTVNDQLGPLRTQYACTAQRVMQLPNDANDLSAMNRRVTRRRPCDRKGAGDA
jgi:hypothetical protein